MYFLVGLIDPFNIKRRHSKRDPENVQAVDTSRIAINYYILSALEHWSRGKENKERGITKDTECQILHKSEPVLQGSAQILPPKLWVLYWGACVYVFLNTFA